MHFKNPFVNRWSYCFILPRKHFEHLSSMRNKRTIVFPHIHVSSKIIYIQSLFCIKTTEDKRMASKKVMVGSFNQSKSDYFFNWNAHCLLNQTTRLLPLAPKRVQDYALQAYWKHLFKKTKRR